MKITKRLLIIFISILALNVLAGEKMYVTDRVLLGVHENPSEESPLLDSVPSGTEVEILDESDAFKLVRLPNDTEGWVSAGYLVAEKPATAQLDSLRKQLALLQAKLKSNEETLSKTKRELQVRSDQLSNARTSIKDLKKKAGKGKAAAPVDTKMAEELAAANQEIVNLKKQLAEKPRAAPVAPAASDEDVAQTAKQMQALQAEAAQLRQRIANAVASLQGETPVVGEPASQPPSTPMWYWALLLMVLILGIIGGVMGMDFRFRKRHGGFRV